EEYGYGFVNAHRALQLAAMYYRDRTGARAVSYNSRSVGLLRTGQQVSCSRQLVVYGPDGRWIGVLPAGQSRLNLTAGVYLLKRPSDRSDVGSRLTVIK
ncbi:MAG: hypothetical protein ABIK62_05535, partial [candidate division WOR-3 bacterium]